jgi:iron complex outermembrane receptor protein
MNTIFISLATILLASIACFAQATGNITGKVTYANGLVLHGVTVQIVQTRQSAVTDETGTYQLSNVPPGRYTMMAWHERTKRAEQVVEVTAGGPMRLSIVLETQ